MPRDLRTLKLDFNEGTGLIREAASGDAVAYMNRIAHERWPDLANLMATAPGTWNAAIEAVHKLVSEAADPKKVEGGDILDRLPNAIWALRK